MKKWISLMLALALCFTMAACGGSKAEETEAQLGGTIDFDIPEMEIVEIAPYNPEMGDETTAEAEMEIEEATEAASSGDTSSDDIFDSGSIFAPYNPSISTETTPSLTDFEFDFSIAPYECEVNMNNPVQIDVNGIEFEMAEYDVSIDESTFDAVEFMESSIDNFSQADLDTMAGMDTATIIEIAEYRASLLAELSHAFRSSGLAVTVNEGTGEIALDSAVLFAVDKSDISDEGAAFLKQFLGVYTAVVFNEKYDGFVSSILVEGHTDTSGNYDYNLKLSQARADSVMAFCLSEESGIDSAYIDALSGILEAVGYSYDKPVYDANGNVDMDASRRVSFRFLIELP